MVTRIEHSDGVTTFETPKAAIDRDGQKIVLTLRSARGGAHVLALQLADDREMLRDLRALLNDGDVVWHLDLE